jgi:hypothetical protein
MSVVKPRRFVGSGTGVGSGVGEAAGVGEEPGAADAPGVPVGADVAVGAGDAVASGVGVARTDGRGVSDSTGPGVNWAAHVYAFVLAPWKKTNPMSRTPARNAPPMIHERYFSKTVCCRVRRALRDGLPLETRLVEVLDVVEVVDAFVSPVASAATDVGVVLAAAPSFVEAAGRAVGVVPRAGRRDFLANSGISVGCAPQNGAK